MYYCHEFFTLPRMHECFSNTGILIGVRIKAGTNSSAIESLFVLHSCIRGYLILMRQPTNSAFVANYSNAPAILIRPPFVHSWLPNFNAPAPFIRPPFVHSWLQFLMRQPSNSEFVANYSNAPAIHIRPSFVHSRLIILMRQPSNSEFVANYFNAPASISEFVAINSNASAHKG